MNGKASVTIVGMGDDGWPGLGSEARDALRQAAVISGAPRHLALLPDLPGRRIPLPSPLLPYLDDLVAENPGLCLVASGDLHVHWAGLPDAAGRVVAAALRARAVRT